MTWKGILTLCIVISIILVIFVSGCGSSQAITGKIGNSNQLSGLKQPPVAPERARRITEGSVARIVSKENIKTRTTQIHLATGWNTISFPLQSVVSTSGFTHYLYKFADNSYTEIDPLNHPEQIDCRYGYWAYADDTTNISVEGIANTTIYNLSLCYGWNLIGVPFDNAQTFNTIKLTYDTQQNLLNASSPNIPPDENKWVYSKIYNYRNNEWVQQLASINTDRMQEASGYWLWCWNDQDVTTFNYYEPPSWNVHQNGNILEIAYGSGEDFPQYAALHTDSGYLRLIPTCDSGWGTSVVVTPSFWEKVTETVWEDVSPPEYVKQLISYNNSIYALTDSLLYKSEDSANSWQQIPISLSTGKLNFMDIDQNKIYIACRNGIVVSENLEGDFSWSFHWTWDSCDEIDMQDGYGWCCIANWGSRSGLNRKTPDGDWVLAPDITTNPNIKSSGRPGGGGTDMAIDPIDPYNIMYINYVMTTDGGATWQHNPDEVILCTIWDDLSTAFGHYEYTDDRGQTWKTHGLDSVSAMVKGSDNLLYAASNDYNENHYDGGIFRGVPNQWVSLGLKEFYITDIAVNADHVFAGILVGSPSNPDPDNVRRGTVSDSIIYHQGALINVTWQKQGNNLLLSYSGAISELSFAGTILLNPPAQNSINAEVGVATSGHIELADKPNEAFKPVMLSSMHINGTEWDCNESFIGTTANSIPEEQWLVPDPITNAVFGLEGGSSTWKQNAPSVTITLNTTMSITGWVTPSTNPNDDNVGMWPSLNTVPESWNYTITATKKE